MGDHEQKRISVDTIWFHGQRVLRTAVQVLIAAASLLAVVVAVAPDVVRAVADVLPASWVAWLVAAIAFLASLSAALSRVMAIPAVNALLTRVGLGSVPRAAAQRQAAAEQVGSASPPQITDGSDQVS